MTSSNQFFKVHNNVRAHTLSTAKLQLDSDWQRFTPTLTVAGQAWGTTIVNLWRYRIVGRTLSVKGTVLQTVAGTSAAGSYTFTLPTGCNAYVLNYVCGPAYIEGATKRVLGQVRCTGTTWTINYADPTSASTTLIQWGDGGDAEFKFTANGLTLSVTFDVELAATSPILQ